jgi:hypothetical protein
LDKNNDFLRQQLVTDFSASFVTKRRGEKNGSFWSWWCENRWRSSLTLATSATSTIRVPEIFAETLLEIARELDKGLDDTLIIDRKSLSVNRQIKKEQLSLSSLRVYKHSGHKVLRLQELLSVLQSVSEGD